MGRKKLPENCTIKPWLSARPDCKEGRFIQIGNSLMFCRAYQALSGTSKHLYQCMAMESGGRSTVTLTHGTARKKYGIPPTSYDRAIQELVEAGFVERVFQDPPMQYAPSTFLFCNQWKEKKE